MNFDLFAGVGWDLATRWLGLPDPIGFELDRDVCATRALHAMPTVRCDVAAYPLGHLHGLDGLIASPPCTTFSNAGKKAGWEVLDQLLDAIRRGDWTGCFADPITRLVLEVGRWTETLRPRWVACEQVPAVLPVWEAYAHRLTALGYRTWCGILNAADYGVPQTRRRAILLASLDRQPRPPAPTHAQHPGDALFGTLEPWVSMAEALGWTDTPDVVTRGDRQTPGGNVFSSSSSWGLTEKARSWMLRDVRAHGAARTLDEPAMTIAASADNGDRRFVRTGNFTAIARDPDGRRSRAGSVPYEREVVEPAPTVDGKANGWTIDRRQRGAPVCSADDPAPTMTGQAIGAGVWDARDPEGEKVRLTIGDALVLQSFPPDFALAGTRTAQFRQVGNAAPPLLAARILAQVADPPGR